MVVYIAVRLGSVFDVAYYRSVYGLKARLKPIEFIYLKKKMTKDMFIFCIKEESLIGVFK